MHHLANACKRYEQIVIEIRLIDVSLVEISLIERRYDRETTWK